MYKFNNGICCEKCIEQIGCPENNPGCLVYHCKCKNPSCKCHQTKEDKSGIFHGSKEEFYNFLSSKEERCTGFGVNHDGCKIHSPYLVEEAGWEKEQRELLTDIFKKIRAGKDTDEYFINCVRDLTKIHNGRFLETTRDECAIENSTKCNKAITSVVEECKGRIMEEAQKLHKTFLNGETLVELGEIIQLIGE